ncbi:MAG: hypothetical protein K8T89_17885 [Planctomycetes bacterium]|nr:hypothetical protein [Planctomycetota bacterium]
MAIITKELAEKIAKKLGATIHKDGAHQRAEVWFNGVLIASFGIRHGSSKELGHDHIPDEIFLSKGKAKRFGQCQMSMEQWIAHLRTIGELPEERS